MEAIIHFLDSARGIYIPRDFAQIVKREYIIGIDPEILDFLAQEDSQMHESYWDSWHEVLDNACIIVDNVEYTLHHDGDLWLINYDAMTGEEKENFGFDQ